MLLLKKKNQTEFFKKKIRNRTETGSNRPVSVRFSFLKQKPVQTGLARFFRFGLVFFRFGLVFSVPGLKNQNRTGRFFQNFNRFFSRFGFFGYFFSNFLSLIGFLIFFNTPNVYNSRLTGYLFDEIFFPSLFFNCLFHY